MGRCQCCHPWRLLWFETRAQRHSPAQAYPAAIKKRRRSTPVSLCQSLRILRLPANTTYIMLGFLDHLLGPSLRNKHQNYVRLHSYKLYILFLLNTCPRCQANHTRFISTSDSELLFFLLSILFFPFVAVFAVHIRRPLLFFSMSRLCFIFPTRMFCLYSSVPIRSLGMSFIFSLVDSSWTISW